MLVTFRNIILFCKQRIVYSHGDRGDGAREKCPVWAGSVVCADPPDYRSLGDREQGIQAPGPMQDLEDLTTGAGATGIDLPSVKD
jgi:hypothetical protein